MMNDKELSALVARYLDGDTTLEEEKQLAGYFRQHKTVSPDLLPIRAMVIGLDALSAQECETPQKVQHKPRPRLHVYLRRVVGIAASLLLLVGLALTLYRSQNYCEATVYGRPVNNPEFVMEEVSGTMEQIDHQAPVENQLRDVLMSTE